VKRLRKLLSILLLGLLLPNLVPGLGQRSVLAAGYEDPLGLLPDWAALATGELNAAAPPDPLAGLLPRNPLEGLLPSLPTPQVPAAPASGQTGSSQVPTVDAPGKASLPTPPAPPQRPGDVSLTDGSLTLRQPDLSLPGLGPALGLERVYRSKQAETEGAFGYG